MAQRKIRVLLVDDEEELTNYLARRLRGAGFAVSTAASGRAAVAAVEDEDFDVAIVDLRMPGLDGIETQRLIKERRPYLQSVVLTGHGSLEAALRSGQQDAARLLQKPVDLDQLVGAILDATSRRKEQQLEAFQREAAAVVATGNIPHDIVADIEALRRKYGVSES